MSMDNRMAQMEARILETPTMEYRGRKTIRPQNGAWNLRDLQACVCVCMFVCVSCSLFLPFARFFLNCVCGWAMPPIRFSCTLLRGRRHKLLPRSFCADGLTDL